MKYLMKFNESIKQKDEDIKDILLEIEDLDHMCVEYRFGDYNRITIDSYPNNYLFLWEDIKDCVLRLIEYLGNSITSIDYEVIIYDSNKPFVRPEEFKLVNNYSKKFGEFEDHLEFSWIEINFTYETS